MNKVDIKKAVGVIQNELTKYGLMTPSNGIDFPVSIMVEQMENETGKMVPHIVAKWNDVYGPTVKIEEMNKHFSAELFAMGITQKSEWIKADIGDKVAFLAENQFGHPSKFPAWLANNKAA